MHRSIALVVLGILIVASGSYAASWTSFKTADISGITINKPFQVNVLDYTVTIGANPTVTVGSSTYKINYIQGIYILGATKDAKFTATQGTSSNGWSWDSKTSPGQIAGWMGQGNNKLTPGNSMKFGFKTFDPTGNPVVTGYKISYQMGNINVTDWFKMNPTTTTIPEPSSFAGLGAATGGLVIYGRRKKRTA